MIVDFSTRIPAPQHCIPFHPLAGLSGHMWTIYRPCLTGCTSQLIEEYIPRTPCMAYLSTISVKMTHMYVNMPFMEYLGLSGFRICPRPSGLFFPKHVGSLYSLQLDSSSPCSSSARVAPFSSPSTLYNTLVCVVAKRHKRHKSQQT